MVVILGKLKTDKTIRLSKLAAVLVILITLH